MPQPSSASARHRQLNTSLSTRTPSQSKMMRSRSRCGPSFIVISEHMPSSRAIARNFSHFQVIYSPTAHRMDRLEAAEDEAPGVERNFARNLEALVLVHLCLGGFQRRLVGPYLPREHDPLALLRIDRATEVGVFAARDVVLPAVDDLDAAIFPEQRRPVLGPSAIGLQLFLG